MQAGRLPAGILNVGRTRRQRRSGKASLVLFTPSFPGPACSEPVASAVTRKRPVKADAWQANSKRSLHPAADLSRIQSHPLSIRPTRRIRRRSRHRVQAGRLPAGILSVGRTKRQRRSGKASLVLFTPSFPGPACSEPVASAVTRKRPVKDCVVSARREGR